MKSKVFRSVLMKIVSLLFLLGYVFVQAPAQDLEEESFVQNLLRYLTRSNWDAPDTGELERHLLTYEWKNLTGVDPGIVAQALRYGRERGISAAEDLADMAYQLSRSIKEMLTLGLEPREVLMASMNAVRVVTAGRLAREGEETPGLAQTFEEQIRRQIQGVQQSALRRQAERRVLKPERTASWAPPTPEERASGGGSNLPTGAGNQSGLIPDSPGGNGGR